MLILNRFQSVEVGGIHFYLNTSYVDIKLASCMMKLQKNFNLNTSYVDIKRF